MPGPGEDPLSREDTEALLEVRRELGTTYDAALVDSFADRIERVVAERVDAQVAVQQRAVATDRRRESTQTLIAILSLAAAVPITIPLGLKGQLWPLLIAWIGIVVINVAHAMQRRRSG